MFFFRGIDIIFTINKLACSMGLVCKKKLILRISLNENCMLLRSGRMTNNSQRKHSNNNNSNNNVANTSTNISGNNEQNQTNLPSTMNNEMVVGISHANNDPINVSGEDMICSQVQTSTVETSLSQIM